MVRDVRDDALRLHQDATARRGRLSGTDVSALGPSIRSRLRQHAGLIIGLGLIIAPDVLDDESLRLEWWQHDIWDPLLDPRIPLRDIEPRGRQKVSFSNPAAVAARRHDVLLAAGPRFGVDGAFERYLRLPFTLRRDRMDAAVERLALAWQELDGIGPVADTEPVAVA